MSRYKTLTACLLLLFISINGHGEVDRNVTELNLQQFAKICRSDAREEIAFCNGWITGFISSGAYHELIGYKQNPEALFKDPEMSAAFSSANPGLRDWCVNQVSTNEILEKFVNFVGSEPSKLSLEQQFAQFLAKNWPCA